MSSEISSLMYIGDVPWHGEGVYVGDNPITSDKAIIAAGLDWRVNLRPLVTSDDEGYQMDVMSHSAIVRESDNKILGVVGNRYEPVQNVDAFKYMDSLVHEGLMRYHTAGSLRGGKKTWMLGKIGSFEVVNGDQVDEYIFFWNSHDGSSALRCLPTTIRVVCANTAALALDQGKKQGISIRHTSNVLENLHEAKEILAKSSQSLKQFQEFAAHAAKLQMNKARMELFVNNMFPDPPKPIRSMFAERNREKLIELMETGRGIDIPGVQGTGWGAFNAVTEYVNYHKRSIGKNQQARRFESVLFGGSANIINKAAQEIIQLAA